MMIMVTVSDVASMISSLLRPHDDPDPIPA